MCKTRTVYEERQNSYCNGLFMHMYNAVEEWRRGGDNGRTCSDWSRHDHSCVTPKLTQDAKPHVVDQSDVVPLIHNGRQPIVVDHHVAVCRPDATQGTPIIRFHYISREARPRRNVYIGHGRLCVCLCQLCDCLSDPRRIPTLLHGPGCNLGIGMGCRLVVQYWADLQSFFDNTDVCKLTALCTTKCVWRRTRNVSECLYVAGQFINMGEGVLS